MGRAFNTMCLWDASETMEEFLRSGDIKYKFVYEKIHSSNDNLTTTQTNDESKKEGDKQVNPTPANANLTYSVSIQINRKILFVETSEASFQEAKHLVSCQLLKSPQYGQKYFEWLQNDRRISLKELSIPRALYTQKCEDFSNKFKGVFLQREYDIYTKNFKIGIHVLRTALNKEHVALEMTKILQLIIDRHRPIYHLNKGLDDTEDPESSSKDGEKIRDVRDDTDFPLPATLPKLKAVPPIARAHEICHLLELSLKWLVRDNSVPKTEAEAKEGDDDDENQPEDDNYHHGENNPVTSSSSGINYAENSASIFQDSLSVQKSTADDDHDANEDQKSDQNSEINSEDEDLQQPMTPENIGEFAEDDPETGNNNKLQPTENALNIHIPEPSGDNSGINKIIRQEATNNCQNSANDNEKQQQDNNSNGNNNVKDKPELEDTITVIAVVNDIHFTHFKHRHQRIAKHNCAIRLIEILKNRYPEIDEIRVWGDEICNFFRKL